MKTITTTAAPEARGHYSQAVVHGGLVYVAGQLPLVPGDAERRLEGLEAQAHQVLDNVAAVLEAAGSSLDQVLRATVYITDVALWPAFNAIYAQRFGAHRPARTVVPVPALHYGFLVEMDAIAVVPAP